MTTKTPPAPRKPIQIALPEGLLDDLKNMIDQTRKSIASTVNSGLTQLYWHVGSRIRKEILQGERAEYGKKIVATVSRQLATDYGKGFEEKSLRRMIQFAEVFTDYRTIQSLTQRLCWSHFRLLIPIRDTIKRDFYAEMCRIENMNMEAA